MRNEFCTLFDINYLPRGLVLYRSLERHCTDFRLRVFCMDDRTKTLLDRLALPKMKVISLAELESHDRELVAVKPTRTQVEYCWTATPAVCRYSLEREPDLEAITYLDADLMFVRDPEPVWEEFGGDSVLIVPHRYAPQHRHLEPTSGTYNVQFMTFRQDPRGLEALHWWHERCIEWCYYRVEDGKLGDQKYLDDWTERFEGVHVLEHPGAGMAPWNVDNYRLERRDGSLLVDGRELVFYHYHSLRLYRGVTALRMLGFLSDTYHVTRGRKETTVWAMNYPITPTEMELVWQPYLRRLGAALAEVRVVEPGFDDGYVEIDGRSLAREAAGRFARRWVSRTRSLAARAKPSGLRRGAYRDSWKLPHVAQQMSDLAESQLQDPDSVAPYRTFLEAIEALVRRDRLPEPARLLDVGCGVGHYSELLERSFAGRFLYTGCDYAEPMIATARARWPERTFVVGDLFDGSLDLSAYDVLLASALVDVSEEYDRALDLLLGSGARYVFLHRQQVTSGPSRAEVVPGYEGQTTYRSYLNRSDLYQLAERHGRRIVEEFEVDDDIHSFVLEREAS